MTYSEKSVLAVAILAQDKSCVFLDEWILSQCWRSTLTGPLAAPQRINFPLHRDVFRESILAGECCIYAVIIIVL